jgi:hypothetical protein
VELSQLLLAPVLGGGSAPDAPANVAAVGQAGKVHITWDASAGAANYQIQRSLAGAGVWTTIAVGIVGTSYDDETVLADVSYDYQVRALSTNGLSPWSSTATAAGDFTGYGMGLLLAITYAG